MICLDRYRAEERERKVQISLAMEPLPRHFDILGVWGMPSGQKDGFIWSELVWSELVWSGLVGSVPVIWSGSGSGSESESGLMRCGSSLSGRSNME